ncbi:MAG TPA: ribonuclease E [Desulfobulbaceae bacterium]|nr:ribonuclease E [Desulfobulbaceae bacterium]
MTENQENAADEPVRREEEGQKVTTGAWWKSAFNLLPKKKSQEGAKEQSADEGASSASSPPVRPEERRPSATSPEPPVAERQDAGTVRSERAETSMESDEAAAGSGAPGKGRKSRRSKRGGRRKKGAANAGEQNERVEQQASAPDKESEDEESPQVGGKTVAKLLINAEEPEECRIALIENGRLESFHVTSVVRERTKNNIYKGRIVGIEPSLQAAFVEIGTDRNGFLPFDEIHPEYYREDVDDRCRQLIADQQWRKLKIEQAMKKGQEVLVQVVKEATGNKGANMTTYLSIPGRYLVLMPGSDSAGISKKIAGEEKRFELRELMNSFAIPEGIGYIIRTASVEITKTALQKDLRYLLKLWEDIKKKGQELEAPSLVFEDQDIVVRFLRDHFVADIQEILVDTEESFDQVMKFVELLPSRQHEIKVKLHKGPRPIFNLHNVEEQIESIYKPQVQLPSGGSIVISPTEALVAIDVNSGRTSKDSNFEESIFLANMEAAAELARQLRLRDLGGLIVVDFIDMKSQKHIREVEKQVKLSMKRDKAKADISTISRFGLMQISRQKMGAPIEKGSYRMCEHCQGRGVVRTVETQALYFLRRIQTGIGKKNVKRISCALPLDVAQYLLNNKRADLVELEARHHAVIDITMNPELKPGEHKIDYLDS